MASPFTEEHELFRKQVQAFAEKELAPHLDEDAAGPFVRVGALRVRPARVTDPLVPFRGAVVEPDPA